VAGLRVLDVGGGASTLVDDLLEVGAVPSVLDISPGALTVAQERLGERAKDVSWVVGTILEAALPVSEFDFWHDRAVFHFLTAKADRHRYTETLPGALKPGGHVVIGTFSHLAPP
jgi:SAM-dependent methyltransferase